MQVSASLCSDAFYLTHVAKLKRGFVIPMWFKRASEKSERIPLASQIKLMSVCDIGCNKTNAVSNFSNDTNFPIYDSETWNAWDFRDQFFDSLRPTNLRQFRESLVGVNWDAGCEMKVRLFLILSCSIFCLLVH